MADSSRWKRHRTNKTMDKKRTISGSFKAKKRPLNAITQSKYKTYRWADEEEDTSTRVADPIVRTNFFIIPEESKYEHYWAGLETLLYGSTAPAASGNDAAGYNDGGYGYSTPRVTSGAGASGSRARVAEVDTTAASTPADDAEPKRRKVVKTVKKVTKKPKLVHNRYSDDDDE